MRRQYNQGLVLSASCIILKYLGLSPDIPLKEAQTIYLETETCAFLEFSFESLHPDLKSSSFTLSTTDQAAHTHTYYTTLHYFSGTRNQQRLWLLFHLLPPPVTNKFLRTQNFSTLGIHSPQNYLENEQSVVNSKAAWKTRSKQAFGLFSFGQLKPTQMI